MSVVTDTGIELRCGSLFHLTIVTLKELQTKQVLFTRLVETLTLTVFCASSKMYRVMAIDAFEGFPILSAVRTPISLQ